MNFNFAIFASGSGSNACAIIEQAFSLGLKPKFLFTNNDDAGVIGKVKRLDIKVITIEQKKPQVDIEFEKKLVEYCQEYNVE